MISLLEKIIRDPAFPEGRAWRRCTYAANEIIVKEGAVGRTLYMVECGEVRVSGRVVLENDRRVQPGICDLKKGDIFGELSLFQSHPRSASILALNEVQLVEIDGEYLSAYLDEHPEIGYKVLRILFETLIERLNKANQKIGQLFAWGLKAHRINEYL